MVLFEKSGELGGKLHEISRLSFKIDMCSHLKWLIDSTKSCGADVRLNTEATVENVMAEQPDAIFVATGSDRLTLNILGIDGSNVYHVLDVDAGKVKVGNSVVICGGGLSGMECALGLAIEGKQVTVVDMIPADRFAMDAPPPVRLMLLPLLEKYDVKYVGDSKVLAFSEEGVEEEDRSWRHRILKADSIVTAFGMKRDDELYLRFRELLPEVYAVGDCGAVGNIMNANQTAFHCAVEC